VARHLVLITEHVDEAAIGRLRAASGIDVVVAPTLNEAELRAAVAKCSAVGVRISRVSAVMISEARNLKVIAKHGVGTDNIDVAAATARGIPVLNTPDANKVAVAEHAMALLLALAKRLPASDEAVRRGDWGLRDRQEVLELAGRTLAVIGFGRSGQELAMRARAFGMDIVTWGRTIDVRRAAVLGVEPVGSLSEALTRADAVSLHVPRPANAAPLVGTNEIAQMRPGALFINCARGGVVDETALAAALSAGHLGGAGIDVFDKEPPAASNPLLSLSNVILTPHAAGNTRNAMRRMAMEMAENILDALAGRIDRSRLVNPAALQAVS